MQAHEPEILESRGVPYDFVPMEPRAHIIISEQAFAELKAKGFYHFATVKSERLYYFFANTPELERELAANYQASRDYQQGGL